jgi:adenylate kinase
VDKHKIVQLSTGDMLRAAAKAGTPIGLKAKDIMDRGELVPDDMVVRIVADRIEQPDAKRGFILDGFPRTVPQAEALDRMLAKKAFTLDGVLELKVDDGMLLDRIEKRASETLARGEAVRADDNPETLKKRLLAYYAQTAPLAAYYARKGRLSSLDGMASIDQVARAIDAILKGAKGRPKARRKPASNARPVRAKAGSKTAAGPKPRATKKAMKSAAAKRKGAARRAGLATWSGRRKKGTKA